MIPKIIHQSWKTTDLSSYGFPALLSKDSWKRLYPDFEYKFWTDNDITNYIKQQSFEYQDTFNALDENIKKMDFFRYLILHEYGGIYSDMDFVPTSRIADSFFADYNFLGYKAQRWRKSKLYKSASSKPIKDKCGRWVLGQAFFACTKEHNGIHLVIKDICKNRNCNLEPLNHTGPEKIHSIFVNNNLMFSKLIHVFSMLEMGNGEKKTLGGHFQRHRW